MVLLSTSRRVHSVVTSSPRSHVTCKLRTVVNLAVESRVGGSERHICYCSNWQLFGLESGILIGLSGIACSRRHLPGAPRASWASVAVAERHRRTASFGLVIPCPLGIVVHLLAASGSFRRWYSVANCPLVACCVATVRVRMDRRKVGNSVVVAIVDIVGVIPNTRLFKSPSSPVVTVAI